MVANNNSSANASTGADANANDAASSSVTFGAFNDDGVVTPAASPGNASDRRSIAGLGGRVARAIPPDGPRTTTVAQLETLRGHLRQIQLAYPKRFDILSSEFPDPPPLNLANEYINHGYQIATIGARQKEWGVGLPDKQWWTRVPREKADFFGDKTVLSKICLAMFFVERNLSTEYILRIVPRSAGGSRIPTPTEDICRSHFKSMCERAKSEHLRRLVVWVFGTVLLPDFDEAVTMSRPDRYDWWRSRVRIPSTVNNDRLVGNKILTWIYEPFASAIDLPWILCTPHTYISEEDHKKKLKVYSWIVKQLGIMAELAFTLMVDHDPTCELFQQFRQRFHEGFYAVIRNQNVKASEVAVEEWPIRPVLKRTRKKNKRDLELGIVDQPSQPLLPFS